MTGARRKGASGRRKGVRGELEVAHLFRDLGYPAQRGQQHDGLSGSADVVGVPYIWIEVKRKERLVPEDAMRQAERDSRAYNEKNGVCVLPVVIHRSNNSPWKVTTRAEYLMGFFGVVPFSTSVPMGGLVTMMFDEWVKVYQAYKLERERG